MQQETNATTPTQNASNAYCDLKTYQLQEYAYMTYNQYSIIPAALIIIALLFMRRRVKFKRDCWDGRPGVQIPVDFLLDEENRFSYAMAYGAMAIAVTTIFFGSGTNVVFNVDGHPYIKVFQSIVTVISIGTIYLPFFMCLSTDAKLLGAVFGFIYTLARGAGLSYVMLICPVDSTSMFIYWPIMATSPAILCHLGILIRYLVIFVIEVKDKCYKKKFACADLMGDDDDFVVGNHYVDHVKTLLQGAPKIANQKWYVKGRNFVYAPEPHFKYSVAILSTVVVAAIIIYELVIIGVGQLVGLLLALKTMVIRQQLYYIITAGPEVYELLVKFLNILIVSFLVTIFVSAFYMYFQMYRMLVSHRNHVIKLIKGDRRFLPNSLSDPHIMVGMSLRFAGYQVAYFLWGFILVAFVLLAITLLISACVLFLPLVFEDDLEKQFAKVAIAFAPTIGMAILVFLVQQILARFVFKDRSMDSKVVNVHNRRLFLLVSFFFFFFNILVGLISCLLRILKGMILGVLFIGRIDRPLIMKGFTNLDSAYIAYIGFLHLQVAHKHPVVRVFSHLLWSGMRRKQLQRLQSTSTVVDGIEEDNKANGGTELKEITPSRPRVSASALNKWFIAVTVIRNPILIYNRKGFLKHILMGIPNSPSLNSRDGLPGNSIEQTHEKHLLNGSRSSSLSSNSRDGRKKLLKNSPSINERKDISIIGPTNRRQSKEGADITAHSAQDEVLKVEVNAENNTLNIGGSDDTKTDHENIIFV